jgi:hypothetical protein
MLHAAIVPQAARAGLGENPEVAGDIRVSIDVSEARVRQLMATRPRPRTSRLAVHEGGILRMNRNPTTARRTALVVLALALLPPVTAQTAVAATPDRGAANAAARQCVVDLSGTRATACFASTRAAASYATRGRRAGSTHGDHLLGVVYQHRNFGGRSTWFIADQPCTPTLADVDKRKQLRGFWNDRISSFHGYSGCRIKLWEHHGTDPGASSTWQRRSERVSAAMEDEASVIELS